MRPSGRAGTSGAPPAQASIRGFLIDLRASTVSTVVAMRSEFWSSARMDFSKQAAAPSLMSFSSFFCDRLVSTMTGMCMVAGFSFRAFRTFGPLTFGSILSSRDDVGQFLFGDLQGFFAVGGGVDR